MSRIVVFGKDRRPAGEFAGTLDRGWMLGGNPSVTGGGSTVLTLAQDAAAKSFLQFGNMVLINHPTLPAWAGVIDPPWNAVPPVSTAIYNAEYLLSLRSPDQPEIIEGSVAYIAARMIDLLNIQEDLFVRLGNVSQADLTSRQVTLDGQTFWDQLTALVQRSGCELQARAEKDASGRLITYLDIAVQIGVDTGFLYSDGRNGNATFSDLRLDGPIINRVIGTSDESGQISRLRTAPHLNTDSIALYGMRSETVQFRDIFEQSTLERYTQNYLNYNAFPRFSFLMNILDKGDAYLNARLGNSALVNISNGYFPGGVKGWRGTARILAMAYTEAQHLLTVRVEV